MGSSEFQTIRSQPFPVPDVRELDPALDPLRPKIVLGDFGSAQFLDATRGQNIQPTDYRAPEVVLGHDWDEKVDIWSLGCLTFQLVTGQILFPSTGSEHFSRKEHLLAYHLGVTEESFPPALRAATDAPLYLNGDGETYRMLPGARQTSLREQIRLFLKPDVITESESILLEDFIRRCLRLDPTQRAGARDLLSDPWLQ